jgi:hypothetical protein
MELACLLTLAADLDISSTDSEAALRGFIESASAQINALRRSQQSRQP